MSDVKFIDGLIAKAPNERAPEYVKAKLSIKRGDLIAWLQGQDGEWINAEIKVSQSGKWYAAVDDWKPDGERRPRQESRAPATAPSPAPSGGDFADDIPF